MADRDENGRGGIARRALDPQVVTEGARSGDCGVREAHRRVLGRYLDRARRDIDEVVNRARLYVELGLRDLSNSQVHRQDDVAIPPGQRPPKTPPPPPLPP